MSMLIFNRLFYVCGIGASLFFAQFTEAQTQPITSGGVAAPGPTSTTNAILSCYQNNFAQDPAYQYSLAWGQVAQDFNEALLIYTNSFNNNPGQLGITPSETRLYSVFFSNAFLLDNNPLYQNFVITGFAFIQTLAQFGVSAPQTQAAFSTWQQAANNLGLAIDPANTYNLQTRLFNFTNTINALGGYYQSALTASTANAQAILGPQIANTREFAIQQALIIGGIIFLFAPIP